MWSTKYTIFLSKQWVCVLDPGECQANYVSTTGVFNKMSLKYQPKCKSSHSCTSFFHYTHFN